MPQYSLSYACLKLVNYAFFFWLPFYLNNNYGWKEAEADRLSVWYDVGGIVGEWGSAPARCHTAPSPPLSYLSQVTHFKTAILMAQGL